MQGKELVVAKDKYEKAKFGRVPLFYVDVDRIVTLWN